MAPRSAATREAQRFVRLHGHDSGELSLTCPTSPTSRPASRSTPRPTCVHLRLRANGLVNINSSISGQPGGGGFWQHEAQSGQSQKNLSSSAIFSRPLSTGSAATLPPIPRTGSTKTNDGIATTTASPTIFLPCADRGPGLARQLPDHRAECGLARQQRGGG